MVEPLVSILMNCYNGEKYLREAIDSILAQTYKNWELIFWDNASTDKSAEIAKSYNDNRLKYFRGENNVRLGEARNLALSKISGRYLCFLDTDDIWFGEKLFKQVEFMEKNKDVILSYVDAYYIFGSEISTKKCSDAYEWNNSNVFNRLIEDNFINLQTVILNLELCKENLYFDKEFTYAEECELFIRLSLIGKFDFIKEPLVYYRVHSGNMSKNTELVFYERKLLIDRFLQEIENHNINPDVLYSDLYKSMTKTYLYYGQVSKAKEMSGYLLKYPDSTNLLLYIFIKMGLGNLLGKIAVLKSKF